MIIIDDFLTKEDHEMVSSVLISQRIIPWTYYPTISPDDETNGGLAQKYNFQFVHIFYSRFSFVSGHTGIIQPFVNRLKPKAIVRIKANLQPRTDTIIKFADHIDFKDCKTAIYYVNSNNGKTVFADGTTVDSKANRMVIFDSNIPHAGTTCTDEKVRCAINFNYIENDPL